MGKRKALESEEDTKATDQVDQTAFSKVKKNKGPTALVASPEFIDQNLYYSPSEPVDIVEESRVGPGLLSPSRDILIIVDGNLVESDSIGSVEVPDFTDPVESEINSSNSIDSVEVPYFIDPDDYSDSESEVDMAKELEGNNSHSTPSKLALNTDGELAEEVANNVGSRDLRKLASPSKHFQEMPKEDVENDKIITINQNNFAAFIKYLNPERDDSAQANNDGIAEIDLEKIAKQNDKFSKHKLLKLHSLTVDQIKDVIKYIKVKNENIGAERPFVVRKIYDLEINKDQKVINAITELATDPEQEDENDSIRQIKGEFFKYFVELLPRLPALHYLDMYHNEIGDEGAKALAEALGRNKALTSIDLWDNKIGYEGVKASAEALGENETLTSLYFGNNKIGDEGAQHLINSLKFNTSLVAFYFDHTAVGDDDEKKLNQFVTRNQEIAKFVQEAPNHYDKKALASIINFVVSIKEEACGSEIASKETLIKENLKNLISQKGGKDDIDTLFNKLALNPGLGDALSSDKFQNILIESKQSLDMPNLKRKNPDAEDLVVSKKVKTGEEGPPDALDNESRDEITLSNVEADKREPSPFTEHELMSLVDNKLGGESILFDLTDYNFHNNSSNTLKERAANDAKLLNCPASSPVIKGVNTLDNINSRRR